MRQAKFESSLYKGQAGIHFFFQALFSSGHVLHSSAVTLPKLITVFVAHLQKGGDAKIIIAFIINSTFLSWQIQFRVKAILQNETLQSELLIVWVTWEEIFDIVKVKQNWILCSEQYRARNNWALQRCKYEDASMKMQGLLGDLNILYPSSNGFWLNSDIYTQYKLTISCFLALVLYLSQTLLNLKKTQITNKNCIRNEERSYFHINVMHVKRVLIIQIQY